MNKTKKLAAFLRVYERYPNPEAVSDERIATEFTELNPDAKILWVERAEHCERFIAEDNDNPCYGCQYRKPDERSYINICLLDEKEKCIRE